MNVELLRLISDEQLDELSRLLEDFTAERVGFDMSRLRALAHLAAAEVRQHRRVTQEHWLYSRDGEMFYGDFPTRAEAIQAALTRLVEPDDDGPVYVARGEHPDLPEVTENDAALVVESLGERLAEESTTDRAAEWPDTSVAQDDDLLAGLNAAVERWIKTHGLEPDWFHVANEEEVSEEELAAARAALEARKK